MPNPQKPDSRMVSEFADDPEMAELVELFITELPTRVAALHQAWVRKQVTDLTRISHQLKGASAGYGFPKIGHAAGTLEAGLKGLDASAASIEDLGAQFQQLIDLCSKAYQRG